eukprot:3583758-Prymnesium_polylepis.1
MMRNGVCTVYTDESLSEVYDTFPLMDCKVETTESTITLSQPKPMQLSLPKSAGKAKPKPKKEEGAEGEAEEVELPPVH